MAAINRRCRLDIRPIVRRDRRGGSGDIRLPPQLAERDAVGDDAREHRLEARAKAGMVEPHQPFGTGTDAGGVPDAMRPHLFHTLNTSKPEGLGLGLAISRQLVEAHGGSLLYEPLPDGSRFVVSLPVVTE